MTGKLKVKGDIMKGEFTIVDTTTETDGLVPATKMEPILAKAQTKAKL